MAKSYPNEEKDAWDVKMLLEVGGEPWTWRCCYHLWFLRGGPRLLTKGHVRKGAWEPEQPSSWSAVACPLQQGQQPERQKAVPTGVLRAVRWPLTSEGPVKPWTRNSGDAQCIQFCIILFVQVSWELFSASLRSVINGMERNQAADL